MWIADNGRGVRPLKLWQISASTRINLTRQRGTDCHCCDLVMYNQVPHLCRETGMSIEIESRGELEQLRTRLRKMTGAQLVNFGKAARCLCRDPKCP